MHKNCARDHYRNYCEDARFQRSIPIPLWKRSRYPQKSARGQQPELRRHLPATMLPKSLKVFSTRSKAFFRSRMFEQGKRRSKPRPCYQSRCQLTEESHARPADLPEMHQRVHSQQRSTVKGEVSVRLCQAVTMALTEWYLLIPTPQMAESRSAEPPLSRWYHVGAYDSKDKMREHDRIPHEPSSQPV